MTATCPRCAGAIVRDGWDGCCIACGYVPGGGVAPSAEYQAETRTPHHRSPLAIADETPETIRRREAQQRYLAKRKARAARVGM